MSKRIEVARPGVVYRLHKARTPKYCSLCGRPISLALATSTGSENARGGGTASPYAKNVARVEVMVPETSGKAVICLDRYGGG